MHSNLLLRKPTDSKLYVEDVFSTYLYNGTSVNQTIVNGIDLAGKGGMVWIKARTGTTAPYNYNTIYDTARGIKRYLRTEDAAADSGINNNSLAAFNSNGFDTGTTISNYTGQSFASWTFRKAPKFFDVVTYTGNGVAGRTLNHSLGTTPGMILVKCTSLAQNWWVWHRSKNNGDGYLVLNATSPGWNGAGILFGNGTTYSAPTATTFTIGSYDQINGSGNTYVAYLFAHDTTADGVIQCGSYTGNGDSSAGPEINLGWEPQYVLIKSVTTGGAGYDWFLFDTMREITTTNARALYANLSDAEASSLLRIGLTSTGFKLTTNIDMLNGSGNTYIYLAIRRGPMRVPTDATKVFSPVTAASGTPKTTFTSGFPPDAVTYIDRGGIFNRFAPRLTGNGYIEIPSTSPEALTGQYWDQQTQFSVDSATGYNIINYAFLRAPGFFDVVCYTGTGVARTVSHNLGVAPELIIVKGRSQASGNWVVYNATLGNDKRVFLNGTAASGVNTAIWNAVSPTSSVFTVGTSSDVNGSGNTYVAYLFASCTGVSKVGSYTGTGATQTISCGFTGGARYVLIKRTDSTGSWWVWDTARGMVAGTDPRLALNFTNAEANANWVYTTTGGFQIVTSDTSINASGGTYIYLAIA